MSVRVNFASFHPPHPPSSIAADNIATPNPRLDTFMTGLLSLLGTRCLGTSLPLLRPPYTRPGMESLLPSPLRTYDVVFCDVDGCLMPEVNHSADLPALVQLAEFNRRAQSDRDRPVIIPCTGRPQPYAEAVCRTLGCPLCICENGAWIYNFHAHRWTLEPNVTPADLAAVRTLEHWVENELAPEGCFLQLGKYASATVFHDDVAWLARDVVPRIHSLIAHNRWPMRVSMTWTCINVDLDHVSKGVAIDRVVKAQGLSRDRLAGIGDTAGDIKIRERVAWFGCPANADEAIRPHADLIASQPLARGVLEVLAAIM